jgi:RNA polymerase sigma-70 factor, ECF subfamily
VVPADLVPLPDAAQRSEAQAVAGACRGDQRAFERLYRAHAGWVFGLCLRLTSDSGHAQDCTQETFVAAWRALRKFERRSRFSSWLHRIAVNVVLAHRKRAVAQKAVSAEEHAEELNALAVPSETGGGIDLERAITGLPQGARDVLVLVGIYGYSHDEAAEMLGVAAGTSKAQLHRARALLSSQLGIGSESP